MADKEKSIIERALMDAKRIQETLNANTKEILRSVAKEEIDGLVKESLTEESYVEEEINPNLNEEEKDEEIEDVELEDEESENEEESEKEDEEEMESDEEEIDSEEEENDNEELASDEQEPMFGDEEEMDSNMDDETGEDFEEIDMTDSSDINDVISIYKKLTGDDEIEVVFDKEDDEMEVKVTEPGEFIVKNVSSANNAEEEIEDEFNEMDESGIMYEIEMDEDYMNEEESEEMHDEEETMEEGIVKTKAEKFRKEGLHANIGQPELSSLEESATKKALTESENKYNTLLTETKDLKNKNEEYKQALKNFRTMLAETVVFNSNLTYVTKLFMEHSTTKEEKQNILKRFDDEVTTIKESKRLYKTIANELSSKTPIKESVEKSLVKEATSSTSKQIHESTAYVDKETQRIMDLMRRVENR